MAKILVADDNSNVQKTVALALADLGVDIVSVNNGEAALRKLSDVSPDLVLADIFMPVRNGYEVCEYVKKDFRFARVPVVLLVGAFDPLDEREAQRVGADGILKKPFVPTEPLVTMVKTLLERALGDRLVAVSAPKPAVTVQVRASASAPAEVRAPEAEKAEETPSQKFPPAPEHVAFGEGERPTAFSQLLETPAGESATKTDALDPVEDEQVLTSSRHETLGEPIFWRNDSLETETEAEAIEPEDDSSLPELRTWKKDEDSLQRREEARLLQPIEPVELVREELDETSPSVVDTQSVLLDTAAQADLTVEPGKPGDLAANPLEWMATAPAEPSNEESELPPTWIESMPDLPETIANAASPEHAPEPEPVSLAGPAQDTTPVLVPVLAHTDATAADEIPLPSASVTVTHDAPATAQPASPIAKPEPAPAPAWASAMDTAHSIPKGDWADLANSMDSAASHPATQASKSASPPATPAGQHPAAATGNSQPAATGSIKNSSPDPALVEAVVQRVLDKMRPQVVDIITKEFLRPIVQALVHREIDKQ